MTVAGPIATQCIQGYLAIAATASATAEYRRQESDGEHPDHDCVADIFTGHVSSPMAGGNRASFSCVQCIPHWGLCTRSLDLQLLIT